MGQFISCQNCSQLVSSMIDDCPQCGADLRSGRPQPIEEPSSQLAPAGRYRPIQSVAVFLQLLFVLFILGSVVTAVTGWSYRTVLLDLEAGRSAITDNAILAEDRYIAAGGLAAVANIVLAAVFVVWFWRAYSNLAVLGRPRKRGSGWAIGAWLIPLANLFIPYGIGAEIWKQSEPTAEMRRGTNMEPVISWWALFVIMGVVNQIVFFNSVDLGDEPGRVAAIVGIDIVGMIVGIGGAVAAIRFVRLATEKQDKLAHSLGL